MKRFYISLSLLLAIFLFLRYLYAQTFLFPGAREFIIGRYLYLEGKEKEGEEMFQRAIAKHSKEVIHSKEGARLFLLIGTFFMERREWGKAVLYLEQGEKAFRLLSEGASFPASKDPLLVRFYLYLGYCYQKLGNKNAAEKAYQKAVEIAPNNPEALNALAYFWVEENKNLQQAVEMLKKALGLYKRVTFFSAPPAHIIDSLGWAYLKIGRINEGLSLLEQAVRYMPQSAEIRYHLSVAYQKAGLFKSAHIEAEKAKLLLSKGFDF